MKTLSPALSAHLNGEVTTLATCWKLIRQDGAVLGFTDHDQPLSVGGVTYAATSGFTSTAIASSSALNIDNLEVQGLLDGEAILEADLLAGLYDYAQIAIFQVDYNVPDNGTLEMKTGLLGQITCTDGQFTVEVRGLTQTLSQNVGELFSPACRAVLGDARCKVAMGGRTVGGSLSAVTSNGVVIDHSRNEAAGRYSYGTLRFTTGANIGLSMEIKSFSNGTFTLVMPLPHAPQVGDSYIATEGCDKTLGTCQSRFGNIVNFRGEPHIPGLDWLLETAGTRNVR